MTQLFILLFNITAVLLGSHMWFGLRHWFTNNGSRHTKSISGFFALGMLGLLLGGNYMASSIAAL